MKNYYNEIAELVLQVNDEIIKRHKINLINKERQHYDRRKNIQ